ncbi:MAG TPA: hypothetical protein VKZ68_06735 [Ohtaekwangia sp.]|nr:hypothetical protein [Ohtaekwangia sp.]
MKKRHQKVKFRLVELTPREDFFDASAMEKHLLEGEGGTALKYSLHVDYQLHPDRNIVIILTAYRIEDKQGRLLAHMSIENVYRVDEMDKAVSSKDPNSFKSDSFLYVLIDTSISHLRGIQGLRMKGLQNIPFIPSLASEHMIRAYKEKQQAKSEG